jgi:nucleotide-binding universal stress UspA family protein
MTQKILIAVDDSENSKRAVDFVSKSFSPDNKVTLFNVVIDTAALCNMDSPELIPLFKAQQSSFCLLEDKKRELVETALKKAKEVLISSGFSSEQITIKAEEKKQGIARDILQEAKQGYNLIVLGRKGITGIQDFFLGSVSQKVFNGAKDISVLIVN